MSSWRETSHQYIESRFRRLKAEHPDLSDVEVLKLINRDHYPFGERRYLPYKAWRQAIREWQEKLGSGARTGRSRKRHCGCWHKDGVIETPCEAHRRMWQPVLEAKG